MIAGALLGACQILLEKGIHPTQVSNGLGIALDKGLEVIESMSTDINLDDREQLIHSCVTSLASKVVSQHSDILAPLAVDAVLKIVDKKNDDNADLRDIFVGKVLGGTVDDTELIDGLVFTNKKASHIAGGPTRIENAKIALIQF